MEAADRRERGWLMAQGPLEPGLGCGLGGRLRFPQLRRPDLRLLRPDLGRLHPLLCACEVCVRQPLQRLAPGSERPWERAYRNETSRDNASIALISHSRRPIAIWA